MVISEVKLSYPYVKYSIDISHFTSRKSTAIEWVILEAINKVSSLKQYEGISIDMLFEQIFMISDSDLLIKPCLLSLQDLGAITLLGIDDKTELKNIPMRNLQMTQTGKKMQKDGLLPGSKSIDKLSIYFDIKNNYLIEKVGTNYTLEATGITTYNLESAYEVDFPSNLVKNLLEDKKTGSKKGKPSWLMPTTTINDITASKSDLYWKNAIKKFHITKNLRCFVDGNDDDAINTLALQNYNGKETNLTEELSIVDISDPDTELKKIIPLEDLSNIIYDLTKEDSLYLVDSKYYKERKDNINSKNNIKSNINFIIIYNSDELSVSINKNKVIIKIPDTALAKEVIYLSKNNNICIGIFNLNTADYVRGIPFAYVPKNNTIQLSEVLISIVEKYFKDNNIFVFLLNEIGLKDLCLEYIERIILPKEYIKDKAITIEEINKLSIQLYNQKIISPNIIEKLLLDKTYISSKIINVDDMCNLIKEYYSISIFKQNDKLLQSFLRIALDSIKSVDSINKIWGLWEEIYTLKKSYIQWISREKLYTNLYSEEIVKKLVDSIISNNLLEVKEYTFVEQTILKIKIILKKFEDKLLQVDFNKNYSDELIMENIMLHKENLSEIYDTVKQWNDIIDLFNSSICDYDTVVSDNYYLANATYLISKIADALKVFFNDDALKFKKVFIVDTCTLIHEPGLISWFSDGKSLLIVPQIVLNELDKLKESNDDSEAFCAREVIRQISNYKAYDWLNIREESNVDLLSRDLDTERNDNKILSIAIKYIVKNPILLTDDINLSNIASSHNIISLDLNRYKNMIEHHNHNKNKNKKKKKK